MSMVSNVVVTPRKAALNWLKPKLLEIHEGHIYMTNEADYPATVKKHDHLADIRDTIPSNMMSSLYLQMTVSCLINSSSKTSPQAETHRKNI